MCAFFIFYIERCRLLFTFLYISLSETSLMCSLDTYSCCSFSSVLSFPFEVECLSIRRLGHPFDVSHLGIGRNLK